MAHILRLLALPPKHKSTHDLDTKLEDVTGPAARVMGSGEIGDDAILRLFTYASTIVDGDDIN